jgi:phenylalanine-4-hydroxylase
MKSRAVFFFGDEFMSTATQQSTIAAGAAQFFIEQRPADYTRENHAVWKLLFQRRMEHLRSVGSKAFLNGIETIGLEPYLLPDLKLMNDRLEPITGWRAVAVNGFLEPTLFFQCLAERRFPTTVIVRPMEQLDYLPEPDIFHDVFGHVPMHADAIFADFLQRFGAIAATAKSEAEVRMLTRLFWFTVEFGLIRENGDIKVYGSGLISSMADCLNALGPNCERRPFVLEDVLQQEFEIDHLQPVLFVAESHQQLFDAVEQVRGRMQRGDLSAGTGAVRLCAHDHGNAALPACLQDLP